MVVPVQKTSRRSASGFTLVEVVVALVIMALLFGGIVFGYTQSSWRAEWSSYNLAAQNLALQGLEQARAAKWDPLAATPVDQCTQANFPTTTTNKLDVPISGTNITYATITWTIKTTSGNYPLKMIQVDCTWPFQTPNGKKTFKNTVATFRAPNQ